MIKKEIIQLVVEDISKAIDVLRTSLSDENNILEIAVQWNRLEKDRFNKSIPMEYLIARENYIIKSLIGLVKDLPDGEYKIVEPGIVIPEKNAVFLSYNLTLRTPEN